ncbi:Os06g0271900 [Oryza sativa Japonica Group]|uniref:Os06g0271900 protein n=2 Tax=Oryza sativa subsp. japonica TaxID=39947 RepID=Q0DCZ5_ORYSJ|nr:Os06g0271900 [Oryza sativa Japonica Group]BAS97196.1 Os06g0271900 [Oryza sativa Japonica Group]|eukprot:NP_001057364.1 Os06g0271900 [Oryza sativa Japonica Group]
MPGSSRAVTRCRWRLHETPTHWQNGVPAVQLPARMLSGSEKCTFKARSAARSVSLPLLLLRPREEAEATMDRAINSATEIHTGNPIAMSGCV